MAGTDNSLLETKVLLRCEHLPDGPVRVLDCFGGYGVLWREVAKRTGRPIDRLGIDTERRLGCLHGDNRKWLAGMDLSVFNVVDLDAYGIPFASTSLVLSKGYKGTVFFTFIQSEAGRLPNGLLRANGITRSMIQMSPLLFSPLGWEYWLAWLADSGVSTVWHRSKKRKHYGVFVV